MFICQDCENRFSQMEQTRSEYRDGQCPACGGEEFKEVEDFGLEKELADLKAMREASRIKG